MLGCKGFAGLSNGIGYIGGYAKHGKIGYLTNFEKGDWKTMISQDDH